MTKPNTKRKLGIENGKTPFLGPGWGQRFVAHRVSGGLRFAFTDKPRQGRQAGGVSKNMVPNTHGFLPPLRGLPASITRHPPLTRWATNLPPLRGEETTRFVVVPMTHTERSAEQSRYDT